MAGGSTQRAERGGQVLSGPNFAVRDAELMVLPIASGEGARGPRAGAVA